MKVTPQENVFVPVVITIETKEELEELIQTLGTGSGSNSLFYLLDGIARGRTQA